MKIARKDMILHTVQNHNILPITSKCDTACVFCSHKSNPKGLDVYRLPKLSLDDINEMIEFLSPDRKIIIGESATRIIEGEPFIRKDILDILKNIRKQFNKEVIEITTNGIYITEEMVEKLKKLEPLEINISLNSGTKAGRRKLLNDRHPNGAMEAVKLFNKYDINYHGSIVAMPMIVGYDDIYKTIKYLDDNKCKTIRVFVPGFSSLSDIDFDFYDLRNELDQYINDIKDKINAPILLEPPIIKELKPIIYGVIKGSKADIYGIKENDIIERVNGKKQLTRVDCFNQILKGKDPVIEIKRGNDKFKLNIEKEKNESIGIIMLYDISLEIKRKVENIINKNHSKKPLLLVSELSEEIMGMLFKDINIKIEVVKNNFFKGTIKSAGLLVVDDFIKKINEIKKQLTPDLIILPSKPFDHREMDLVGDSLYDIGEKVFIV